MTQHVTHTAHTATVILLSLLVSHSVHAYENRNPGEPEETTRLINSPHGRINRLALGIYAQHMALQAGKDGQTDPIVTYLLLPTLLQTPPARKLTGESVVRRGHVYDGKELSLHGTVGATGDMLGWTDRFKIITGDKNLTFVEWLIEAGYTADEPELWMSLRHFYNPIDGSRLSDEHRHLAAAIYGTARRIAVEPKMDARTWALTGEGQPPFAENNWSWFDGVNAMRRACHPSGNSAERDRLFTTAWRSLGETMHLLADMTVPAHVRNDAHAALTPAGSLGPDPYERFVNETVIKAITRNCVGSNQSAYLAIEDAVSDRLREQIQDCETPDDLFHVVASYTNANFFSADTVSGSVTIDGQSVEVHNANGTADLPSPKLQDCRVDGETTGLAPMTLYYRDLEMGSLTHPRSRRVYMARMSWAVDQGWMGFGRTKVQCRGFNPNHDVCISQAQVLVPLALYANTRLVDWFIPRFDVYIDQIDRETHRLTGRVVHRPHGPYDKEIRFSLPSGSAGGPLAQLVVNGQPQDPAKCPISVRDGKFTCDFSGLSADALPERAEVRVYLDLGGIWMRSAPYSPAPDAGYWVLKEVKDDSVAFYEPQWKSDIDVGVLTAQHNCKEPIRCSGRLDQRGTFQYEEDKKTLYANYSLFAEGAVEWQPLPKIIPTGGTWEIRVRASCSQRLQASRAEGDNAAYQHRLNASRSVFAPDLGLIHTDFTFATSKQRTHGRYLENITQDQTSKEARTLTPEPGKSAEATRVIQFNLIPSTVNLTDEIFVVNLKSRLPTGHFNHSHVYEFRRHAPPEFRNELQQVLASSQLQGIKKDTVDYAAGTAATPVDAEPEKPAVPGQTRLTALTHMPPIITAGQIAGFQMTVENAPHAASYTWAMGEPSFKGQPVGWTEKPELRYNFSNPGKYQITVSVRDKRNYSTRLDKKTWEVVVQPGE